MVLLGMLERYLSSRLVQIDLVSATSVTTLRGSQSHGRVPRTYKWYAVLGSMVIDRQRPSSLTLPGVNFPKVKVLQEPVTY